MFGGGYVARRAVLCMVLLSGMCTVGAAKAQTVTFGANVTTEVPQSTYDCTQEPGAFGNGAWTPVPGYLNDSSCTWTTPANSVNPSESLVTPGGTGTITTVRLRVGAVTGPMRLVVLNFEYDPSNENAQCCNAAYVGQPFTPAANSITTLQTSLPVHTDAGGQESAPPYEVADLLALNIDEDGVPIPVVDYTGRGLSVNALPSDNIHWPAYVQGQTDLAGGYYGYQLDMSADWVSGSSTPPPKPSVIVPKPTVIVPKPTVSFASLKPEVRHGKTYLGLGCGKGAACSGTIAIENRPLAGAAAASKGKTKSTPTVIYAQGSFKLAAGKHATVAVPLKAKGRAAASGHKRLTVYIDITMGTHKQSKKLTLRF
jgi:hypothetical protein